MRIKGEYIISGLDCLTALSVDIRKEFSPQELVACNIQKTSTSLTHPPS